MKCQPVYVLTALVLVLLNACRAYHHHCHTAIQTYNSARDSIHYGYIQYRYSIGDTRTAVSYTHTRHKFYAWSIITGDCHAMAANTFPDHGEDLAREDTQRRLAGLLDSAVTTARAFGGYLLFTSVNGMGRFTSSMNRFFTSNNLGVAAASTGDFCYRNATEDDNVIGFINSKDSRQSSLKVVEAGTAPYQLDFSFTVETHGNTEWLDLNPRCPGKAPVDCQLSQWTRWSSCDNTCYGIRSRTRAVLQEATCGGSCPGPLKEEQKCGTWTPVDCRLSEWSEISNCTNPCYGIRTRTRTVLEEARCGGACGNLEYEDYCGQWGPINCLPSQWSPWSRCSKACFGTRSRFRSIWKEEKCGGTCDDALKEVENCGESDCGDNDDDDDDK